MARGPLDRERVLAAATAIADADGLPAVTMRRVAAALGVEAMSLYHHVSGKEALLDGMVERLVDELATAAGERGAGGWRATLRARFLAARAVMLRHPWAPDLLSTRTSLPPSVFAYYEWILATLIEAGFSYRLAHRALHAFGSFALGFAQEVFRPAAAGAGAEADLAAHAAALPHLTAMVAAELHDAADPSLGWCDTQAEFEFTLDLLLAGIERAHAAEYPPPA